MKAEKLPSGSYRYTVYIGKDATGKKLYKKFTSKDKETAKRQAMQYAATNHRPDSDSFSAALNRYIAQQSSALSPATIRGYANIQRQMERNYGHFCKLPLYGVTAADVQRIINALISSGMAPKTVRNYYGVITAVLNANDAKIGRITLPRKDDRDIQVPTKAEVKKIIAAVSGTDLEIPVLLASNAGLRRGEIAALQWDDFDFKKNTVRVSKDIVMGADNKWHTKPPKTKAGDRLSPVPKATMKRIKKIGRLPDLTPHELSQRFQRKMKAIGYPYHLHTMRHFAASYLHSVGIPDAYIMRWLGWENDGILKKIYRHALNDQDKMFTSIANDAMDFF